MPQWGSIGAYWTDRELPVLTPPVEVPVPPVEVPPMELFRRSELNSPVGLSTKPPPPEFGRIESSALLGRIVGTGIADVRPGSSRRAAWSSEFVIGAGQPPVVSPPP